MGVKIRGIVQRFASLRDRLQYRLDLVNFSDLPVNLKACLICMPARLELIRAASEILPQIAETFPNRDIRILLTSNVDPQSHDIIKKFLVIKPFPYDLDTFSLPKKEFIQRVSAGGLAVSVDLDTYPNFFNAVVSLRSGAVVRTAFDKGVGLPYYNFIVGVPAAEAAPRVSCRAMADILSNFKM